MESGPLFEWDERKRRINLHKHGFDFADCAKVFAGYTFTTVDDYDEYGETRLVTFGLLRGRVVAVTHTERRECIRVISMRKADIDEQADYFKAIPD